ncbi:hypothetical protein AB0M36_35435 [Actinoplanes sp. NPDC051346]|uniref:hypothetical protein n=1 Tax=Actinoplanes sp. NPDC051346 TaxID=3155048 RepID=UPI003426AD50
MGKAGGWYATALRGNADRRDDGAAVLTALLSAAGVGLLSAYVPLLPAEPYVVAAAATAPEYAIALGASAAVGQTAGKLVLFYAARGASSRLMPKWVLRRVSAAALAAKRRGSSTGGGTAARWGAAVTNRVRRVLDAARSPWRAALVVLVSAFAGLPPLLFTTMYAGRTQMPAGAFAVLCLTGRTARLIMLASSLEWVLRCR